MKALVVAGTDTDVGKTVVTAALASLARARGERVANHLALVEDLCNTMKLGSLCALGGFTPYPVMSALKHFPEDFKPQQLQAAE